VTISLAKVGRYGSVLVNSRGLSLYLLTSEKGNKVTCTQANSCTSYWFGTRLPAGSHGAAAGTGVRSSLLGTAKDPTGHILVSYATYPLYTFAGDTGAGQSRGEGTSTFGGTWYLVNAMGDPVTGSGGSVRGGGGSDSGGPASGRG
jgi:predicted lipoprotein with Yx(FWY)xxD motif